ncbi:MAG: response regulator [Candidatus Obscuribacterales bacterium]|nr:response regulator [Candidatus Obscuribacterales bacterium]
MNKLQVEALKAQIFALALKYGARQCLLMKSDENGIEWSEGKELISKKLNSKELDFKNLLEEARTNLEITLETIVVEEIERKVLFVREKQEDLESQQLRQELKDLKQKFSAIFDQTFQFTGLVSPEGILLECNQTALKFAGLTWDEAIGKPFWELKWWSRSPEAKDQLKEAIARARNGELVRATVENIGVDESSVMLDFSMKPIFNEKGEVIFLIPEGRDITDRLEAERELELRAEALAEANARLKESEKLKSEFLANVSHELRTPLTLTLAPLETLLAGEAGGISQEQKPFLELMHNNCNRLLSMVNGLLDFSKLEAGKVNVNREAVDIVKLVQTLANDFKPLLAKRDLKLTLTLPEQPLWVEIDRYLTERILFNLLSNAVKFTPAGSVSIELRRLPDDMVEILVSDTGVGIKAAELPNLFVRFRQLEGSSARRFEGTGLGLALVKEFAELMQGDVRVESLEGRGSTFSVKLKAQECKKSESTEPEVRGKRQALPRFDPMKEYQRGVKSASEIVKSNKATVLVAEDNSELANYIHYLLKDFCQVKLAANGKEALRILEEEQPDLILSDVMMPEMDGLQLCQEVKSKEEWSSIPVIFLTALTHRDALLKGWQAGADDYLFKPFHPTELTTRIRSALKIKKDLSKLHQNLRNSRDEALQADTFKSQFVSMLSHEIRTPLNAVIGMSELLSQTKLSTEQENLLKTVQYSASMLMDLLNNVLNFTKLEAGKFEQETIEFMTKDLVNESLELLSPAARRKNLTLKAEIDQEVPLIVEADLSRLRQVLVNLLSNAVKFTDAGEVALKLKLEAKDTRRAILRFSVIDTGCGIAAEKLEDIFKPFFQADASIARNFGGTGLGLAICRSLVESMGGSIELTSKIGRGSCFSFSIPVKIKDKKENTNDNTNYLVSDKIVEANSPEKLFSTKNRPEEKRELILIAEDNPANRALLSLQLKALGYRSQSVDSADRLILEFQKGIYDLIIVDCQMPLIDGFEAALRIRQLEQDIAQDGDYERKRLPILAISEENLFSGEIPYSQYGIDRLLLKPAKLSTLREALEDCLRGPV